MANEMQIPSHIAARIEKRRESGVTSALIEALSGSPAPPRISIKSSRFRLVENGVETVFGPEMDVVIVGANPNASKVYFEGEWDPDAEAVRPDCASSDGIHPDADIDSPVCDTCGKCPYNVLGSKINNSGAKSKICDDVRYVAVVPAGDPTKVYELKVTVTAMKPLRQYIQGLANYGIFPEEVVTHLSFDPDASYPLLTFQQGRFLPEKAITAIEGMMNDETVAIATRVNKQAALPAPESATKQVALDEKPAPRGKATAKASKPAPQQSFPGEQEQEEPKPKRTRGTGSKSRKAPAKKQEAAPPPQQEEEEDGEDKSELESALDNIFG